MKPALPIVLLAVLLLGACTTSHSLRVNDAAAAAAARERPAFDARSGAPLDWRDVLGAAAAADVVVVGEQHDDATGHAVQLAIVTDLAERFPGTVVALEMLERDEQAVLDDYLDGIIDATTLATLTHSADWGAKDGWARWYQPIVDAARDHGGTVVAANAPRRYVRLARLKGYDDILALPPERRGLVDLPVAPLPEEYVRRFRELMGDHGAAPAGEDDADPLRSQRVWDATMARSIERAVRGGAPKVIQLVGQFHSDFGGGLVAEVRHLLPEARVFVVSLQRGEGTALREDDRDRADVVVYTGE
jgi:uncharacterized iron-regulated protein